VLSIIDDLAAADDGDMRVRSTAKPLFQQFTPSAGHDDDITSY